MHLESWGDAKLVDEGRHQRGVGFERDEGWGTLVGVWVCGFGHFLKSCLCENKLERGVKLDVDEQKL